MAVWPEGQRPPVNSIRLDGKSHALDQYFVAARANGVFVQRRKRVASYSVLFLSLIEQRFSRRFEGSKRFNRIPLDHCELSSAERDWFN
jgi:hypothetical protein